MLARRSAALVAVVAGLSLAASACGGDEATSSSGPQATAAPQVEPEAAARTALEDFYAAVRVGDAEASCALQSEEYKESFYTSTSCLAEGSNNEPSDVVKEKIEIEVLDVQDESVETLVQPTTTGVRVYITVRLIDDKWLLDEIELA